MTKKKIIILLAFLTTTTSCGLFKLGSSSPKDSESAANTSAPATEASQSQESSMTEGGSSSEIPPSTELTFVEGQKVTFGEATPADLTNFRSTVVLDPALGYEDEDYPLKALPTGFTYPTDAWFTATNAYLEFWHPETSLDFVIVASNDIFMKIQEHGLNNNKDLYWPVTLQVKMNGKTFTYYEVGMRMKGNTSRRHFVNEYGEFYDNINFKLSFNELWTEDYYQPFNLQRVWTKKDYPDEFKIRDERTFMGRAKDNEKGMKKLDLKWNKSEDKSLVMQPFGFSFLQKHGVISQNSTLTTLRYNNTQMGIVTINEPINKQLLRRYFPKTDEDGPLYKVGWGLVYEDKDEPANNRWEMGSLRLEAYNENHAIIGEENKFIDYSPIYDRKEGPDDDALLINLMTVIKENEEKSPQEFALALEEVIDMDSFLALTALSYLIGNPDDMRFNGNNYYIYFNPSDNNKAYFIPYDNDWAFGVTYTDMYYVGPLDYTHKGDRDSWQKNRLYWYTILEPTDADRYPKYNTTLNRDYQNQYIDYLKAFIDDPMYSADGYNAVYDMYRATYEARSWSDLNNENRVISDFEYTSIQTDFINHTKYKINNEL